jgi:hypothetical protein
MVHLPRRRSVSHNYLPGLLESQLRQLIPGHGRPLEGVDAGGSTGDLAASLVGQAFRHSHRLQSGRSRVTGPADRPSRCQPAGARCKAMLRTLFGSLVTRQWTSCVPSRSGRP